MTAEQLHDAIGLLPGDLLEKTDQLRQSPRKKKAPVTRYLSAAACAAVVLGGALLFRAVGQQKGAAFSAAAPVMDAAQMDEAPAEQAPMLQSAQLPADAGAGSAADRSAAVENAAVWMPPALEVSWDNQSLIVENGEEVTLSIREGELCLTWQTPPEDVKITAIPEATAELRDGVLTLTAGTQSCEITASWPEGRGSYILKIQ